MFKRIAILAALAAGTVLLTACNATESVSDARQGNPAGTAADVQLASSEDDSVDCGEVDVDGDTHTLVAEPTTGGIVGCTEAFNVLDEYLALGTSIEDTKLSNGWSCTTDDGETASIGCVKGRASNEFAFRTEPRSTSGDEQLEPVDCGDVDVNGNTHTLTAEPASDGIVGCTEAFNILDEYLAQGTSIEDTKLSNGWSCTTDDGETAGIGCLNDRTGFAFSTTPA